MDIIKQQEQVVSEGRRLTYFEGMTSASRNYNLNPLGQNYKNMRNDIVHEGKLSGGNYSGKSKEECAEVIAETLNWLDSYVLAVLGIRKHVSNASRWRGQLLANNLPSISVR